MASLDEVRTAVEKLAPLIEADPNVLPTYGESRDMGWPHIEVDSTGAYHWVVRERGVELERHSYARLNDLLYKIFESVTSALAGRWELDHRIEGPDFRRLMFKRQLELLDRLNPTWATRGRDRIDEILREHPFVDEGDSHVPTV
jgi:hypothetical protein